MTETAAWQDLHGTVPELWLPEAAFLALLASIEGEGRHDPPQDPDRKIVNLKLHCADGGRPLQIFCGPSPCYSSHDNAEGPFKDPPETQV